MVLETKRKLHHLTGRALLLALGLVLPFLTAQIPQIGSALLPMHLPVLLCGLLYDKKSGLMIGVALPILRSLLFGMPPLFPMGLAMSVELGLYGYVVGLSYMTLHQTKGRVFISLILAMLAGRIGFGMMMLSLSGLSGFSYTFELFIQGAFLMGIPGIIIQLILVPILVKSLKKVVFI